MVKVILLGDSIDDKKEVTLEFSEWFNHTDKTGDILLYRKTPVYSYEIIGQLPEKKIPVVRESVKEFIQRRKSVKCSVNNCQKAGIHIGDYCNKHLEKAWRIMRKRGISLKQLKTLLEKRRNEK